MRFTRLLAIVIVTLLVSLLSGEAIALAHRVAQDAATQPASAPPSSSPTTPPTTVPGGNTAQRVILWINRDTSIAGYLALEDDDTITIRNLKGQPEAFAKSRITQIVRLVDPKPDQTGIVILRDGQIREGVIIEDAFDYVLLEIRGIRAKLKRDTVDHVVLQPTIQQRYAEYKASLKPGMYDAHLTLCQWLFDQRQYQLAQRELEELLDETNMPEARKLKNLVDAQVALQQPPGHDEQAPATEPFEHSHAATSAAETEPDSEAGNDAAHRLLTDAEVNLIRVYEIDFDNPPKVTIPPDTVRAIIEKYGTNKLVPASQSGRAAMLHAAAEQPLEIVRLMFDLRARDLYSQIQVNSEPYSLNQFRLRVHDTWLMNNCATSRCHGGADAGRFYLHRKNYKTDRVRYTNFLILDRMNLDPAWPLINYEKPEDSLIIQYGMSREDPACHKPHPFVSGWRKVFTPTNPKLREEAIAWIRSMMQPRPTYPVDFDPMADLPAADQTPGTTPDR